MKKNEKIVKKIENKLLIIMFGITFMVITLSVISIYIQKNAINNFKINSKEFEKEYGKVCVYLSGAINNTGLYKFNENTRLDEALNIIGGVKLEADLSKLNLGKVLYDSEKIVIPYKQKDIEFIEEDNIDNQTNSDKININEADTSLLMTLPGIGQATANKIVEYRKNGSFESIEDIKKVSGIGESKFDKIKDKIAVE